MVKRLFVILLISSMLCTVACNNKPTVQLKEYIGDYSKVNGSYGGVDDLGRLIPSDYEVGITRPEKTVGMFYFLCLGAHGTDGPYDNYKIISEYPNAAKSVKDWLEAGGGAEYTNHWWAEPMFGYYQMNDEWVIRKHIQMLADAGVDYLVCDVTNAVTYDLVVKKLIRILDEFYQAGMTNVPKISFYTNSDSENVMYHIYSNFYIGMPDYSHLWFQWDGKPMIVGECSDATKRGKELHDFFRIKANQWPTEPKKDDGWPWMDFNDRVMTEDAVYGVNGRKEVMNVSVAQHAYTVLFSASAFYGVKERTRSWHNGDNDPAEDALLYGYNFAEQWEHAISHDPETIFVTGFNEWTAYRLEPGERYPIRFCDLADPNNSRDVEPMKGLFGDNYYMQLCQYIKKYKGTAPRVNVGDKLTIDIGGTFDQWDGVTAVYTDYVNDIVDRNARGFGNIRYYDVTGRNDFSIMKVVRDENYVYFYVECVDNISAYTDTNWMTLFLRTDQNNDNWQGYDYIVNRTSPVDSTLIVEKSLGGWKWDEVGKADMKVEGNKMMLKIPKEALGIQKTDLLSFQFKWADNYLPGDIWSFYTSGDAAPLGRLNYIFSNIE